ncbi:hypothetical protein ACSU64_25710 [Bacillaceae bacterium C204]|uniref:hypothetical protein n=1 Tax=Neobacillus sp. 204 TaxID=3383351 RepID=UPI00397B80EA
MKDKPAFYTKWIQQFGIQTAKANILGQPQMTINNKFGQGINIIPTYSILEGGDSCQMALSLMDFYG